MHRTASQLKVNLHDVWICASLNIGAKVLHKTWLTHNSHNGISPSFIIIKSCHAHTNLNTSYEIFCPNFKISSRKRLFSWKGPDDKSKSNQRFCLLLALATSVTYLQSVKSQNMILSSSPRSNKSIIILFLRFLDHRSNRFNNREGNSSAIKNRQRHCYHINNLNMSRMTGQHSADFCLK